MNVNAIGVATKDRKVLLSTLWIVTLFNWLYCDVMGVMDPVFLRQNLTGNVGGIQFNEGFLLGAGVLMEIPTVMILLSRVLGYRSNRWANLIAAAIMTIVQLATLFFGTTPTSYYLYYSALEVAATAFILWTAWTWRNPEAAPA